MNGQDLLEIMEGIDPQYIEEGAKKPLFRNKWVRFGLIAAACLLVGVTAYLLGRGKSSIPDPGGEATVAYSITLNDDPSVPYFPISYFECFRYGLLPEGADYMGEDNLYKITEKDIGEPMGIVTGSMDPSLIGCKVYHFASFSEYASICIIDTPEGYQFFEGNKWFKWPRRGTAFQEVLSKLDLPEAIERIEVLGPGMEHIRDLDVSVFEEIMTLLGRQRDKETTVADMETEGECILSFTNRQGFRLTLDYYPSLPCFYSGDGFYVLSKEDADLLNDLLKD
ncbi:MAG: hypothetical protein IJM90_05370 [Firmicutes bacterium]|nr:hypothetical protein [Bacillota bacterium]